MALQICRYCLKDLFANEPDICAECERMLDEIENPLAGRCHYCDEEIEVDNTCKCTRTEPRREDLAA